jgi:hypothetical protein
MQIRGLTVPSKRQSRKEEERYADVGYILIRIYQNMAPKNFDLKPCFRPPVLLRGIQTEVIVPDKIF